MKTQILLLLGLLSFALAIQVWDNGMHVEIVVKTPLGPSFIAGRLGFLQSFEESEVQNYIQKHLGSLFELNPTVEFILERQETDLAGMIHFRFDQQINKLPVQYSKLIIHAHPVTREVYAISSDIVPGWTLPTEATFSIEEAKTSIATLIPSASFKLMSEVELVYLNLNGKVNLVYKADIIYETEDAEMRSYFYLDAVENVLVSEINRYVNALNRLVYSANNGRLLPGTIERTEGQPASTDSEVNDAYDNSGICYNYYYNTFKRDSYNDKGAALLSTVHYGQDYNNAFWNGEQMVYGDGDGVQFSDFAGDLTVVCHELTHAVVEYTANLVYQDQPGALNEGFADILGFSSYMYQYGADTQYQWMIGPFCYTPFKAGDALRYMNNPPEDGSSYDYYPGYEGFLDNGGVHWNSGIANLAYVLAVQGGTHPQQKSTIYVEPIGISAAEQIFYSVLNSYLTSNSQFANARASSVVAARALYGVGSKQAITADTCWEAVGVPASFV